jgi:hypothetical protein
LYAVIFGGDTFIQEDYKNYKSIGISLKEIEEHPNDKIKHWTTQ